MKNGIKLILVLIILVLIILMEIFVKTKSIKTNSIIPTVTPTQIQKYYEYSNQPTTSQENLVNKPTDEISPIPSIDSEVGPTLTDQQAEEAIKINKETGGFHTLSPEDVDNSTSDTIEEDFNSTE